MTVCIIGWYGTETIGDRAILTGIFSFLQHSFPGFKVKLGSLYPYFSKRTLEEDHPLYKKIAGNIKLEIELFDSTEMRNLEQAIRTSDLLIMGGGPLMHINAMFMIEYAFKLAKKTGKKSFIFGCGVGPLNKRRHKKATLSIVKNCDYIVLRDQTSKNNLEQLAKDFSLKLDSEKILTSLDPSIQCLLKYQEYDHEHPDKDEEFIAINLREFPAEYTLKNNTADINGMLVEIIERLSDRFENTQIRLIPMHYFHIGNDDRMFLNKIAIQLQKSNLEVQNVNLTLEQTLDVFRHAKLNVGMRFHSVVFQTILNGKNLILDYTEPEKGKISGFVTDIGGNEFYKNRYLNLQQMPIVPTNLFEGINTEEKFTFDKNSIIKKLDIYRTCLEDIK